MKHAADPTVFAKDRPILLLVIFNGLLTLASVASVVLRLRPNDFKIPVQYIVYDGTIVRSGTWYSLYGLVLFTVLGCIMTVILAHKLHKANRLFALTAVALYSLVAVYSLITINALLGLVERI